MKTMTITLMIVMVMATTTALSLSSPTYATTGMSDCTEDPDREDCNPQPDRVGADDPDVTRDGPDEGSDEANCWGKVTSDVVTTNDGDGFGGKIFGSHAADPVQSDDDNETPREGVGNQDEDHPSDHADTVGPRFGSDEECAQN